MTPKFVRTSIPERETLGEKLAKKRAALGYDIKEAERATRIRAKYLELLEAGSYDALPPDVYVRGFLKNYAGFLRLDQNKVIRLYLKEKGLKENVKKVVSPKSPAKKPRSNLKAPKMIVTPKRIAIGFALIGALLVFSYIGWQVSILTAPPKLSVQTPNENSQISGDSLVVEGKTDAGADVFINDVPIGVDPEGNFKEKISLQDGVNLIKIASKNKLNKVTQVTRTVLAKLGTIAAAANVQKKLEMEVEIGPNSAKVNVSVDGKQLSDKNGVMLPGSSQIFRANQKISISASDGGSVRVILNGKDLGLLGKSGEKVKSKEFTINSV